MCRYLATFEQVRPTKYKQVQITQEKQHLTEINTFFLQYTKNS